jgi:hypothetical protein
MIAFEPGDEVDAVDTRLKANSLRIGFMSSSAHLAAFAHGERQRRWGDTVDDIGRH